MVALRWVVFCCVMFCVSAATFSASLNEMIESADAVLQKDTVQARADVGIVFAAADQLADQGDLERAAKYYRDGLQIQASDFLHHMRYAALLIRQGKQDDAKTQAKIVLNSAEDYALIQKARTMLGIAAEKIEPLAKLDRDKPMIVLVPVGDADELLLQQERALIEEALKMPVLVRSVNIRIPAASRDKQWDAVELLDAFRDAVRPYMQKNVRFIGITNLDIYKKGTNFLFGWRDGLYAIASYARFTAEFNNETPRRTRLISRLYRQCLASAGHILGLLRCDDPSCPRAYPESLSEQDAKTDHLCDVCAKGFAEALTRVGQPRKTGLLKLQMPKVELTGINKKHKMIPYDVDLINEPLYAYIPSTYEDVEPYGLLIFIYTGTQQPTFLQGWRKSFEDRKLIVIALSAGEKATEMPHAWAVAVSAVASAKRAFTIDENRIYISGIQDGARVANALALLHPELFNGGAFFSGATYFEPVAKTHTGGQANGNYGWRLPVAEADAAVARDGLYLVFVTYGQDARRADILDIVENGYDKGKFLYRLLDLPKLNEGFYSDDIMQQALSCFDAAPVKQKNTAKVAADDKNAVADDNQPLENKDIPQRDKPVWAGRNSAQWPVMALFNDIMIKPNIKYDGATSFLMRLPNDAVVGVTVKHYIDDSVPKLEELNDKISRWAVYSRGASRQILLGNLAMKKPVPDDLDLVILQVKSRSLAPYEILNPRRKHLVRGEKVYLMDARQGTQIAHECSVIEILPDKRIFNYRPPEGLKSGGLSGAPILDQDGYVIGVHQGRKEINGKRTDGIALDLTYVTEWADAPAPEKAPVAKPAAPSESKPTGDQGGIMIIK